MYYFAYGSNMSRARLQSRVPNAELYAAGCILRQHKLCFHKVGMDGSGKCDALFTGDATDSVEGVVYRIDAQGLAQLDRFEGTGYDQKIVTIILPSGEPVDAITYCANTTDPTLIPFDWYRQHVLTGALEAGLSESTIRMLQALPEQFDRNRSRRDRELKIYDSC